jgi:hypothetical protein
MVKETDMQKPSVGRIVHFYTRQGIDGEPKAMTAPEGPHVAIVTRVWGDDIVNLRVIPDEGSIERVTSVRLFDSYEDGASRGDSQYCIWPPRVE